MKKENLYTIRQAAKVCGTSRASILRMEEAGLIHASYVSPESGYRYYDYTDIGQIVTIRALKEDGATNKEVLEFYNSGGDCSAMIKRIENRIRFLEMTLSIFKDCMPSNETLIPRLRFYPAVPCYEKTEHLKGMEYVNQFLERIESEFINSGLTHSNTNIITTQCEIDYDDISLDAEYTCCIPYAEEEIGGYGCIPEATAVTLTHFGTIYTITDSIEKIGRYIKEHGYTINGPLMAQWYIAPYIGKQISENRYVTVLAQPIQEP